jgi:two-component system chemotaxis response regulator CheY
VQILPLEPGRYVVRNPGTFPPESIVHSDRAAGLPGRTCVVIVDDDPFFRSLLKVMIAQAGLENAEILEAEDSNRAFDICENHAVDLVFCDLHLPALRSRNGLEIIRELRYSSPETPMYMVTADNNQELVEEVRAVGATGHILKPISLRVLKRVLVSTFAQNQS